MRSTDKDLLVAQDVLGKIKWGPKSQELLDKARARDAKHLSRRLVVVQIAGEQKTVPAKVANKAKRVSLYELTANFEVRKIPHNGVHYTARVTFNTQYILGQGATNKDREYNAKDSFRTLIVNGLRDETSALRQAFFDECEVVFTAAPPTGTAHPAIPDDVALAVKESFRKWIGNSLRKVDGVTRERFFKVCKHVERELTNLKQPNKELGSGGQVG